MKTVILWGCIGLSALILVAAYYQRGSSEATPEHRSEAVPDSTNTEARLNSTVKTSARTNAGTKSGDNRRGHY